MFYGSRRRKQYPLSNWTLWLVSPIPDTKTNVVDIEIYTFRVSLWEVLERAGRERLPLVDLLQDFLCVLLGLNDRPSVRTPPSGSLPCPSPPEHGSICTSIVSDICVVVEEGVCLRGDLGWGAAGLGLPGQTLLSPCCGISSWWTLINRQNVSGL